MLATESISSMKAVELPELPKRPRIEYATGRFHTDLVSTDGLCLAILEDTSELKYVVEDLQQSMSQGNASTGLVVISPESRVADFELTPMQLADIGIAFYKSPTLILRDAAINYIKQYWENRKASRANLLKFAQSKSL
ncbi:hypothetical protein ACEN9F_28255 [Duganella sp. CT11-25]|uniref:hypothetical protein n=1 Tax=unclassified Duganella TaxID=2636909 RepID=UPI0039B02F8B